jgi:hypothetical protein
MKSPSEQILDLLSEYKNLKIKSAKKSLRKILGKFDVELVSYELRTRFLDQVEVKLKKEFSLPKHLKREYPELVGETFSLGHFMQKQSMIKGVPEIGMHQENMWVIDLNYALKTWMLQYGCDIEVLVGDRKDYPLKKKYTSLVKRRLHRYGWKAQLLVKMGLGLFGGLFWKLAYETIMKIDDNPFLDLSKDSLNRLKRVGSSQASWAILSSGVSQSRVEAHIIRLTVNQLLNSLEKSPLKEELYKHVGDNLQALPAHLSKLERSLDRTNYALITMGGDWYRQRLVHEDREMVDMASKFNPLPVPSTIKKSHLKQANLFKDLIKKTFYTKTENLLSAVEEIKKVPEAERRGVQKKLMSELEVHKKKFIEKAYGVLESKLEGFQYEIIRFEPSSKLYSNITVRKKDQKTKFSLKTLESSLKKKAREEELSLTPKTRFKDLLFVLENWKFQYGQYILMLIGESSLTFSEKDTKLVARLSRWLSIGAKKAIILLKALFLFFDPSALGIIITFLLLPKTLGYQPPAMAFGSALFIAFASMIFIGRERAVPHWKRFKRI